MGLTTAPGVVCRRIRVRGQVQGVGFRPHVWRLAQELSLVGWVRNDGEGVEIEAQGAAASVDALLERLQRQAPPLARISAVESHAAAVSNAAGFVIAASQSGQASTSVTPDTAICTDCLAELCEPGDRRWRYAFGNCTHCGPRYTITRTLPYDRPNTAMATFPLCPDCRREYESPADRRFHAQPIACPACGPRLSLRDSQGALLDAGTDPIATTLARLARGEIVAIKSLGGFHLACDARNSAAVAQLRLRKQREEKPFALMLANAVSAEAFAALDAPERAALELAERPIVLLRKRADCDALLEGIAPGLNWIGAMLPAAPLHYLLFFEAAGRPAGLAWLQHAQPLVLVMTSANPGGEPIARDDAEAYARLAGIADAWLVHDRAIVNRCDDSLLRMNHGTPQFIRRARGYTPRAIRLPGVGASVLAVGAGLKSTICLTRGNEAFVSAHIGDLDNAANCTEFEDSIARLIELLQIAPKHVVCDLHPDLHSTRWAAAYAHAQGLPLLQVQHHHAHIAAVAAEHGVRGPLLGLALDGVGLGVDGQAWGGELLRVDGAHMLRLGHLAPLRLPGGDRAAREPWRMAAAALHRIGRGAQIAKRFGAQPAAAALPQLLERGLNSPWTSSTGRWFDAAAGLLGLKPVAAFEGQAAMLLEGLAEQYGEVEALPEGWHITSDGQLDLTPLIAYLADAGDVGQAAACFHSTLAQGLTIWVLRAAEASGIAQVAMGGGCWLNRVLSHAVQTQLAAAGLQVWQAREVPPNDGGLSLGQAWIAMNSKE